MYATGRVCGGSKTGRGGGRSGEGTHWGDHITSLCATWCLGVQLQLAKEEYGFREEGAIVVDDVLIFDASSLLLSRVA